MYKVCKNIYIICFSLIILILISSCSNNKLTDKDIPLDVTSTQSSTQSTNNISDNATTKAPTIAPSTMPAIAPTQSPDKNTPVNFTRADFTKVDGSTATIPLSEAAACELLNLKPEEASRVVRHFTTHNAYKRLIEKAVDIILVTEPSKEELELAEKNNLTLEVVPVVKDAFVFLANKKNKIESLTVKQIQDIYSGKLTNWNQVGGSDGEILAYQRPVNSGSQTLMLSKVMNGIQPVTPEKHMEPAGMGDLIEVIAGFDNSEFALGYSVYYYANTMYLRDTVKLIGVNGVKPEPQSIKTNEYPLSSAYYAVIRKDEPKDSFARAFLSWLLSEQGQKTAEKIGYITLK